MAKMTVEEAKAVVLTKYPHATVRTIRTFAHRPRYVVKKNNGFLNTWLSGEHYTEEAAWLRAARNLQVKGG